MTTLCLHLFLSFSLYLFFSTNFCLSCLFHWYYYDSQRMISRALISRSTSISKNIVLTHSLFYLHFNSSNLKLLILQSKFSRTENLV